MPGPGEVGHDTWEGDSWKTTGGANVWTLMSADEELGYVYLPFGTPTNDYYGGDRHGDNLFGESLVCVDARTGRRIWHQQIVRHGLWDYDLPAAPNLIDVTVDGRRVKAVAQVTKQGFVFVFDRVTGAPALADRGPRRPAVECAGREDRGHPAVPHEAGPGRDPGGARGRPDRRDAGAPPRGAGDRLAVRPRAAVHAAERARRHPDARHRGRPELGGRRLGSRDGDVLRHDAARALRHPPREESLEPRPLRGAWSSTSAGPQRLPLFKPPWGSLVAIDMSTGEHRWRVPVGSGKPDLIPGLAHLAPHFAHLPDRLGWPTRSFVLVTRSLLLVVQQGYQNRPRPALAGRSRVYDLNILEPKLYAYDKASGRLLAELALPANASGAPMTYMAGGKQYVAFPVGGSNVPEELIAVALP